MSKGLCNGLITQIVAMSKGWTRRGLIFTEHEEDACRGIGLEIYKVDGHDGMRRCYSAVRSANGYIAARWLSFLWDGLAEWVEE